MVTPMVSGGNLRAIRGNGFSAPQEKLPHLHLIVGIAPLQIDLVSALHGRGAGIRLSYAIIIPTRDM